MFFLLCSYLFFLNFFFLFLHVRYLSRSTFFSFFFPSENLIKWTFISLWKSNFMNSFYLWKNLIWWNLNFFLVEIWLDEYFMITIAIIYHWSHDLVANHPTKLTKLLLLFFFFYFSFFPCEELTRLLDENFSSTTTTTRIYHEIFLGLHKSSWLVINHPPPKIKKFFNFHFF